MRLTTLTFLLFAACGSSESKQPAAGSAGSAGSGSAAAYDALGKKPANARRPTPPPGIETKALAVGAKAPAVALVDAAGAPWQLTASLAKHARVMLVFYRGDWCPHCRKQLGELQSKQADFAAKGLGLVAISVDEVPAGRALTAKLGLGFPILSDPKAEAIRAFGVFDEDTEIAWASIFVVDKDGTIVKRWLADTYSQRVATDDVLRDL